MWTGECIIVHFIYFTTCTHSILVFASVCIQRTPIPMIFYLPEDGTLRTETCLSIRNVN